MARPRKITDDVLRKLEEGFLKGLSDREACLYADVKSSTFYDYCKTHKGFSERKELLKEQVKMRAKINVSEKIAQGDIGLSLWYLERRCRDEFSLRQEVAHSGQVDMKNPFAELSTDDLKKLVRDG